MMSMMGVIRKLPVPVLLLAEMLASQTPAGVDLSRWKTFDLEAKWAAYARSVENGASKEAWVAWLRGAREYALLEWMAVFGGWNDPFSKGSPGLALAEEDAPQWMRTALWNLESGDSHNRSAAEQKLLAHAAKVWGWLEKYPEARPAAKELLRTFKSMQREQGLEPEDPGNQLPPLNPVTLVLPYLDAPRDLPELGDRPRARRSGRYLHQVLRGLAGVASGSLWEEPYRGKVLRLTRHPHDRVRQAAFLTFTKSPAHKVPYHELLEAFAKQGAPREDRRHALLALSYSAHPAANLLLHEVAKEAAHPCRDVALSRLGEIGNGFTVTFLASHEKELQAIQRRKTNWPAELRPMLERAAWAKLGDKPYAEKLVSWTLDGIRNQNRGGKLRGLLQGLARGYVPPEVIADVDLRKELRAQVRAWAQELAGGRGR